MQETCLSHNCDKEDKQDDDAPHLNSHAAEKYQRNRICSFAEEKEITSERNDTKRLLSENIIMVYRENKSA